MSNYDDSLEQLGEAADALIGSELESYHLNKAQVYATLALVDAQREATAWGKEQMVQMRTEQTDFMNEVKRLLAEED